jgi:hypothetical protein
VRENERWRGEEVDSSEFGQKMRRKKKTKDDEEEEEKEEENE